MVLDKRSHQLPGQAYILGGCVNVIDRLAWRERENDAIPESAILLGLGADALGSQTRACNLE